mmetsp:Transcript_13497/g.19225  ORF Transcript_13497/g.19225 Transcript_13497/m.19225 type:complete len:424 (-) Transcript_13497:30-1301(-)
MKTTTTTRKKNNCPAAQRCLLAIICYAVISLSVLVFDLTVIEPSNTIVPPTRHSTRAGNETSIMRVIIIRTVSLSEIPIVQHDVRYVQSFYHGETHKHLLKEATQYCDPLKNGKTLSPYKKEGGRSQFYPNFILCNTSQEHDADNYISVHANFMLFALSPEIAAQLTDALVTNQTEETTVSSREVDVNIIDVSSAPKKLWNWILHANSESLEKYDYVWFIDGDIQLTSLNWHAFFMQVRIMRPKISQPASINDRGSGSVFKTLTHQRDPRIIAAEVPIIEVQAPLIEVQTWLKYSQFIQEQPELIRSISVGGENCFDMGWCHFAKSNMTGRQQHGIMWDKDISFRNDQTFLFDGANSSFVGRSCIVFYQTPIVHISKKARKTNGDSLQAGKAMCDFFRGEKGVIDKSGLHKVNKLFNYEPINN